MMKNRTTMLIILDGFGYRKETDYNAIAQAHTPHLDRWWREYPHALLAASGPAVGLPEGYIGNSEVGHLTIGAGKIITQPVTLINEAIANGTFFTNPLLQNALKELPANKTLHILGLLSDAGVHSHINHIQAYIKAAQEAGIQNIILHLFLDGRDVPPQSAAHYLEQIDSKRIGTIHGRFYAMDRDKNWERTQKSIDALTKKQMPSYTHWKELLNDYYKQDITDEFIPPTVLKEKAFIKNGDGIIFANFRPDRARQLTAALKKIINPTFFITPVAYGNGLKTTVLYPMPIVENTLKEQLIKKGKSIFSIAETEKYAHVTYFFGGGKDKFEGETQILIPSIPAKNYIDHPEMSAKLITDAVLNSLTTNPSDFYLINYANADMVGHSGNFQATVAAIECLDHELARVYNQVIEKMDGTLYITADHGNAEEMIDEKTGQVKTSHTTNPVPFIMIQKDMKNRQKTLPLTQLSDIAPFILHEG